MKSVQVGSRVRCSGYVWEVVSLELDGIMAVLEREVAEGWWDTEVVMVEDLEPV